LLKRHRAKLDALAKALNKDETVEVSEVKRLFERADAA